MVMQMNNILKVEKIITSTNIPCKTFPVQNPTINICCRANKLAMQKRKSNNNFYEVLSLGSDQNIGFDQIKRAYRRMVRRLHPDVCPSSMKEESTKKFVELQKAYETLSDPVSRRIYDYEIGLVESLGFVCAEKRGESFSKEVWEKQLNGLKQRSSLRMERKRN